ncbi:hypothetical protein DRN74_06460, partial [Candidatus Micrarchaeota archaeon]
MGGEARMWRSALGLCLAFLLLATGVGRGSILPQDTVEIQFPGLLLDTLPEWERVEQMRDWVVYGFLTSQDISSEILTVALHDRPPIRQPALSEVHKWQYGVGRWAGLPGEDPDTMDLYCFLPRGADERLLGPLADDFRRLSGQIPAKVYWVAYRLHSEELTAEAFLVDSFPGTELFQVGGRFGYREREIGSREDLCRFLQEIDSLTYAEIREGKLVLGGRDLPDKSPPVNLEDIAVLYQAYLTSDEVGFSLDPYWLACADLLTVLPADPPPGVSEERWAGILVSALFEDPEPLLELIEELQGQETEEAQRAAAELTAVIEKWDECSYNDILCPILQIPLDDCATLALVEALPEELPGVSQARWEQIRERVEESGNLVPLHGLMKELRAQGTPEAQEAYAQLATLLGQYVAQCPRYDGDIAGTELGMTLFYCDLLCKLWVWNYEGSTPRHIGLVPELELPIAEVYWHIIWELPGGRLWFDLDYSKLRRWGDSLLLPPWGVRLFAAADDPENPGMEVPPRDLPEGLRTDVWLWNARWAEIVEEEPQYFRLNEIHKWSAVIAWLKGKELMDKLGFLESESVTRDKLFPNWLEEHREELAFKGWLPFVNGLGPECLSIICSESRPAFGSESAFLYGGVSLADPERTSRAPDVPEEWYELVQEILRSGTGRLSYPTPSLDAPRASYEFDLVELSQVTPGPDASFRAPHYQFPRLERKAFGWQKTGANRYSYRAEWQLSGNVALQEKINFEKAEGNRVLVEYDPSRSPQLVEWLVKPRERSVGRAQDPEVDAILSGRDPNWRLTEPVREYLKRTFEGVGIEFVGNDILIHCPADSWPVLLNSLSYEYALNIAAHTKMLLLVPTRLEH